MSLDAVVVVCLAPLALWILISGLDDLLVDVVFLLDRRPLVRRPGEAELGEAPRRRIAIFVPLWHEDEVIGRMLERNIAVIRYPNYEIFAGAYPNDAPTIDAVNAVCARHPHVHLSVCPHDGPTSKADCLNWIYRRMVDYERECGVRFEVMVTHDAEDLVDAQELALIDYFAQQYDMVQIPVLPLATPLSQWVHGLYCDEFAEYQTKDIPVRQRMGGFLPSNGVGTGFARAALEELAGQRGGQIFERGCLTEDYENGFAIHALGRAQVFVPLAREDARFIATREYFPGRFRDAVRQRARWVTGIALQGWERHGWRVPGRQLYWFWRDRKGLVGSLLTPPANAIFAYGLGRRLAGAPMFGTAAPNWIVAVCGITLVMSMIQMVFRAACSARIYGAGFALWAPVRSLLGNWLNAAATIVAVWQFAGARWRGATLAWRKTEHRYPEGGNLRPLRPLLGELLVEMRHLSRGDLETALRSLPQGRRLGEHLLQLRMIDERKLYEGLSSQYGIPLAEPWRPEAPAPARCVLPAEVTRRWGVVPVRVEGGELHVGVTDVPSQELREELRRFCSLPVRYWLYPPSSLRKVRKQGMAAFGN